ncbi:hypothetical protein C0991_000441 [Blastosporella zonata]|nr:hypothetical protein C0991_000441 [Blastosporella zonata]
MPVATFTEEKPGWHGYVEWEGYPQKKTKASKILNSKEFCHPPEFQLVPLPKTNPILIGERWKQYHHALDLDEIVHYSWDTVQKEKPDLIHLLDFPYNGETRRDQLLANKLTDNRYHFVRNHGGVPNIEEDAYELEIGGLVNKSVKISLADLKDPTKFPQEELTVTLQCSGTRRVEQILQYPGDGDELINAPWGEGAMKNNVFNYAVSVPWRKVRHSEEVLLAWEMNGQPLPKIHGAPLRVVVTGYIGARSTKWVYKINALSEPSMGPVQQQEYLYYTSQARWADGPPFPLGLYYQIGKQNTKFSNGFSIQQMPVSWVAHALFVLPLNSWACWLHNRSAIITPEDKQVVIHDGKVTLRGWAIKIYSVNKSRAATAERLRELEKRGIPFEPLTRPLEFGLETTEEYSAMMAKHPREPLN